MYSHASDITSFMTVHLTDELYSHVYSKAGDKTSLMTVHLTVQKVILYKLTFVRKWAEVGEVEGEEV